MGRGWRRGRAGVPRPGPALLTLLTLLAWLTCSSVAPALARLALPPPTLQDVRVWFCPADGRAPQLVLWWTPSALRARNKAPLERGGRLRIRALVSGGLEEGPAGVRNRVTLTLRDGRGETRALPVGQREIWGGVLDKLWRIPERCPAGELALRVELASRPEGGGAGPGSPWLGLGALGEP